LNVCTNVCTIRGVCTCLYNVLWVKSLILLEGAGFITQRAGVQISPLLPVVARDLEFEAF